jgi:hypothetical protein
LILNAECAERQKHKEHIVTGCTTIPPFEYTNRHNKLAGYIHWKIRTLFQNQLPIGWLKKYKIENKTLLYGTVTYITALLLHTVAIHI